MGCSNNTFDGQPMPELNPEQRKPFVLSHVQEILLQGDEYKELREFLKTEGACTDRIWVSAPEVKR